MSQAIECRICHKGDTLGPRGVMLTCGQCKRHTHHSCLVPRMTNQHLVALLDTLKNPGTPQFGHPEVWMCPRCFGRNPEAAMKTILGRRFFKPTNSNSGSSSPAQQAQAGPSRLGPSAPVSAAYAPRNSVRSASEQATSSAISVDDDDVEIIDSTASTPQRSATLSTGRSSSRLSMAMDVDDDDIQIVEGPPPSCSASLSSSRQTSRAPSQTNMPPPSRSQSIISRAESMSGMYTSQSPAPLPSRPGISVLRSTSLSTFSGTPVPRHTVNGSVRPHHPLPSRPTFAMGMEPPISQRPQAIASSSRHGLWTELLGSKAINTQKTNNRVPIPRKRRQPSGTRGRSESSEGPSDDPDFPEKRPRTDSKDTSESDRRLAPTVTTEDIRRIQAELRAQGKLAPPPTNYYTNRSESRSRQWWSTASGASSASGSTAISRGLPAVSTSQSGLRGVVPKPVSDDDSDLEVTDGPRKSSSAERPKKRGRSGPPLFIPDSEESEDESQLSRSHTPPKRGVDVKGKGKARASSVDDDIKEEEQVEVKLEALDNLNLCGKIGKSRKRSPDISERLPLHQWKASQKTMDGEDEPEDLKMLSNDKFRIVEKQESGRMGPRKVQHTQMLVQSSKRDVVNVVNHKTRVFSERVGARKREMPAWML